MLSRHTDDSGWRWYYRTLDEFKAGKCFVSVTTVLDCVVPPELMEWFKRTPYNVQEEVRTKSAAIGTELHAYFERYLKDPQAPEPADLKGACKRIRDMCIKHEIKPDLLEHTVLHSQYGYCGTMDAYGTIKDKHAVMDLKTGRTYGIKTGWQLAAYAEALKKLKPELALDLYAGLHVPYKDDGFKVFKYKHLEACFLAFLCAMQCWKMVNWNKLARMGENGWFFLHTPLVQLAK